jgi:hypothetical protein
MNFAATGTLPAAVTVTRSSAASYFNASGVLTSASTNVARFDHSPTTPFAALGLLIEESRKNWIINSADLSTGNAPTNVAMLITTSATLSPDGSAFYQLLAGTAATSAHYLAKTASIAANVANTFSFYVAASGKRYVQAFLDDGAGNGVVANIDTTALTVVSGPTAMGTGAAVACTVTAAPGAAMRVALTCNPTSASGAVRGGILQCDVFNTSFGGTSVGDGTSGYLIWGSQVEVGAFATSHIPTSGAAVTRSQDIASMALAETAAFSLAVEAMRPNGSTASNVLVDFNDSTSGNRIALFDTNLTALQKIASAQTYSTTLGTPTIGTAFKVGMALATGNQIGTLNGAAPTTLASGAIPAGLTTLNLGGDFANANPMTGYLRRVRYWPRALTSAALVIATT